MKKVSTILALVTVVLGSIFLFYFNPLKTSTIGSLTLEDGTELRIVQSFGEPFQIDFYMKRPGEPWGWCYIDHEDTRWSSARLIQDKANQSVKIYNGSTLRAEYFMGRKTFALYAEYQRELAAPQENRVPPT
jgi:hypothetical protein